MKKLLGIACAAAAAATWALAQDSTEGESGEGLTGGQIVVAPRITQYEDWSHVCVTDDEGEETCQAQHVIRNENGGRVATVEVFNVPEGLGFAAGAAIALPLGVSLRDGIELRIDGAPTRFYEFSICVTDGCLARIGLTELAVRRMNEGALVTLLVRVGVAADREVELELSPAGFPEAYQALAENPETLDETPDIAVAQGEIIAEPEIEVIDDWARACLVGDDGNRQCRIRQIILNDSGGPLATIDLFKVADNENFQAGMEIVLPHGVALEDGIEIQIDSSLPRRYQLSTCLPDGCLARIGIKQEDLGRMKAGSEMKVVFYASFGGPRETQVQFISSLIGFTKAFNSL